MKKLVSVLVSCSLSLAVAICLITTSSPNRLLFALPQKLYEQYRSNVVSNKPLTETRVWNYNDEVEKAFQQVRINSVSAASVTNQWSPPNAGSKKINTDGSKIGDLGSAGYGGVIKDEECNWIGGYFGNIGFSSVLEAELWGIFRGLTIAHNHSWVDVQIESDSSEAVAWINKTDLGNHPNIHLIKKIQILKGGSNCTISVISREINKVAELLAKKGANQVDKFVWVEEPTDDIKDLLVHDTVRASS